MTLDQGTPQQPEPGPATSGDGCHGGRETMQEAASAAGKTEAMDRSRRTIRAGRMTSRNRCVRRSARLRVGLRMRRTATILSRQRRAASTA